MNEDTKRRIVIVSIARQYMHLLFTGKMRFVGMPEDAEVMAGAFDYYTDAFLMQVRHKSFPIIIDGSKIMRFPVRMTRLEDGSELCEFIWPAQCLPHSVENSVDACHVANQLVKL